MAERKFLKEPKVIKMGNTVNVLVDLGNCFGIGKGQEKLTRKNVDDYIEKCIINVQKFDKLAQQVYSRDLITLKMAIKTVTNFKDSATFSSICREYSRSRRANGQRIQYVTRYTQEDFDFAASISKRLKYNDAEDILDKDGKLY